MQLRTVLFCSFLAVPVLAACGDDTGGGDGGGDSTSTGSSTTGTTTSTPASSSANGSTGTGGDPTGGGGDPTGGGGDPSGGTGGGGTELSCDTYCNTIMGACTDGNQQYPDLDSCLRSCPGLQEGVYQDADASLGCHQYHADAALAGPDVHCPHAGPQGGGQCGDGCENFCQLAVEVCPGVYASEDVCMKVCPDYTEGTFSVDPPATGDTLGCRLYHLTVAALSDADAVIHCPHTAADSDQCL